MMLVVAEASANTAPMADAPSTPRTAARIDARREALWAVPVIALLGAPWMLGVRPGWMLAGIALGLWRLVSVARRLTSARQHEVVFAPSRAADGWLLVSLLLVAALVLTLARSKPRPDAAEAPQA